LKIKVNAAENIIKLGIIAIKPIVILIIEVNIPIISIVITKGQNDGVECSLKTKYKIIHKIAG
jgi:hypothetical protein